MRVEDHSDADAMLDKLAFTAGAYGTTNGQHWYCCTPNGLFGDLANHTVTEHGDGTITVHPSILVSSGRNKGQPSWHGYLTNGVWREC
jgi:hypothetical protein